MSFIYAKEKLIFSSEKYNSLKLLKNDIENHLPVHSEDYYILCNGKIVKSDEDISHGYPIHVVLRLVGGKGGFGSMLRAIGAQIEKTTNREACRDLSGRRLRDINEEKRLKTWIAQQVEREKEAEDRRQKKLERLCQTPKHEFKDENYEKERSSLPEKVEDALEQGLKASASVTSGKRKLIEKDKKNKKMRLWLESDEELSSTENETDDENGNAQQSADDQSQNADVTTEKSKSIIDS